MNDFLIEKVLGKGSFGSVYLVRRKEDNKIYALKSVILEKLNKKEQENSVNEVRILASVNHPNVIGYKEAFWDDKIKTLNIVMEYADDGDLQTKISKMRKEGGMFNETIIWSYSIQMIEGLKALHDKKIMHRDLKSANIFLVKDKHQCKIGDMNVSKVIKEKVLLTQTGTPYYASPEVWRDEPYSYKSDLWSIGCVIYELCALRPPFKGKDLDELFINVCKGKLERISHVYSEDLWKMINMLLQVDVNKRVDCDKFLNNKLITKKIKEMKMINSEFRNLEKNKDINDGILLDTIRFDNIFDIKRQLPTKKNYNDINNNNNISKQNSKKSSVRNYYDDDNSSNTNSNNINNSNIKNNNNNPKNKIKSNKIYGYNLTNKGTKPMKYQKITSKNNKIIYSGKNSKLEKIRNSLQKEKEIKDCDKTEQLIESKKQLVKKNQRSVFSELEKYKTNDNKEYEDDERVKTENKKSLKSKLEASSEKDTLIYKKPLPKIDQNENSIQIKEPMTTKRVAKKIDFIERSKTPLGNINKSSSYKNDYNGIINTKQTYSLRNNYKKLKEAVSPKNNTLKNNNEINYNSLIANSIITGKERNVLNNVIKKKVYDKKINIKNNFNNSNDDRPASTIPFKRNKILLNYKGQNSDLNKDISDIKNDFDYILNKEYKNNKKKNVIDYILNNDNENNNENNDNNNINVNNSSIKLNSHINSKAYYDINALNKEKVNYIYGRPLTTKNSEFSKNRMRKRPKIEEIDVKEEENLIEKKIQNKKYINREIQKNSLRDKEFFEQKRNILSDRDMTNPELLMMMNPIKIKENKKELGKTLNISVNTSEQNNFLRHLKPHKLTHMNGGSNNNPRYNNYYSSNNNSTVNNNSSTINNNPQIFNNFYSINNVGAASYPVKVINVFNNN